MLDASNNVGIGAVSSGAKVNVTCATNITGIRITDGTYAGGIVPSSLGGMALVAEGAYAQIFYVNGADRARIDASGNLGLGVAPTYRLDVSSAGSAATETSLRLTNPYTSGTAVAATNILFAYHAGGSYRQSAKIEAGQQAPGNFSAGYLAFSTQTSDAVLTEAARIDASGNLGLGVTPKSWSSSVALQIGSSAAPYMGLAQMTTGTADGYMLWGGYLTGNRTFAYSTTGDAPCAYRQNAGAHAWFNAASGTAGGTIIFNQAMTLTANGNLLVGPTSEAYNSRIVVNGQICANSTYTINSSTATNICNLVSGLVYIRDNVTGNNCVIAYDSAGFLTFIVNTNTTFVNATAPSATQIRLDFILDTPGLKATGGSSRNGTTVNVMVLIAE